jgi:Ca2+-binding RTX toxin-like protein
MAFHLFRINELYSNTDGSVQFIELVVGNNNNEHFWEGQSIQVTQGGTTHTLVFPSDLPSNLTANKSVLIATAGFQALGIATPDYIIPSGFLFVDGGTVNFASGIHIVSYSSLPGDHDSVDRFGNVSGATPKNFAGQTGTINFAPELEVAIANKVAGVGQAFSLVAPPDTFGDADGDSFSYAATLVGGGSLPAWLTLDPGTGTFSGTPALGDVGAMDVELTASDGFGGSASDSFSIRVISGHVLIGTSGADLITGTSRNDSITGGGGNDTLNGAAGRDTLRGGSGNDTYWVNHALDRVAESPGAGTDLVRSSISHTLAANLEKLLLLGSSAIDGIGNGEKNLLTGNSGANELQGLANNDTLIGGAGADTLAGGAGADIFLFKETPAADTILDFDSTDRIQLDNSIFAAFAATGRVTPGSVQAAPRAAINDTSGDPGDFLKYATDTGELFYDGNASGAGGGLQLIVTVYSGGETPAALNFTLNSPDVFIV